jgi:flagellar protein FliO/FliZ
MLWYLVKLALVLPLIAGLAYGALRLVRRFEGRFGTPAGERTVKVIETQMLSPTQRLAVIAFHDREILVASSRSGLVRLAEAPARQQEPGA